MFEYAIYTVSLNMKPGIEDLSSDELASELNDRLASSTGNAVLKIEEYNGGRWEIVSHHLLRLQSHLLLSFLLRRTKQEQ